MSAARWGGLAAAVLGAIVVGVDWALEPVRASYGLLTGLAFGYTLVAGALLLLMIGYTTNAVWLVPMRRPVEAVVGAMPIVALLFLPVLLDVSQVWRWAPGGRPLAPHEWEHVRNKAAWLDEPFFLARSALYLVVPVLLGEPLLRWSRQQDRRKADLSRQMRVLSALGLPLLVLTATFAMYDWIMSLEPSFFSTSFGAIPSTSGFLAWVGALAIVIALGQGRGLAAVGAEHTHALGKVMLTAVVFWAYLAFTQYLIIWLGNLPVEVRWYLSRTRSGWEVVAYALIALHFAIPFFLLLFTATKRHPWVFAALGALVLFAHWLELWWCIVPALRPEGPELAAADLGAVALVLGAIASLAAWRLSGVPLVPSHDPLLSRGLRYEAR